MTNATNKAADVARAYDLTRGHGLDGLRRRELFDIIRRCITGLPPDQADKALGELLHEIEVCEQLVYEQRYGGDYSDWHDGLNRTSDDTEPQTDDEIIQNQKNSIKVLEDCQRRGAKPPHPDCPKCGGSGLVGHTRLWPKGCGCIWRVTP
jgi:hypothetical protein